MIINEMIKKKTIISIVAMAAMLILILTGCSIEKNKYNQAGIAGEDSQSENSYSVNINQINTDAVSADSQVVSEKKAEISDGKYEINVAMSGGTGKAHVKSPVEVEVKDGHIQATIEWSSSNYDYMIVEGEKYLPVNSGGNSTFIIPIESLNCSLDVIADTVAMSTPHEIQYTLNFSYDSNGKIAGESGATLSNSDGLGDIDSFSEIGNYENYQEVMTWIAANRQCKKLPLNYADKFRLFKLDNDIYLIEINKADYYLVADNKDKIPNDLPACVTYIERPLRKICVVSTASMDYFLTIDAMDSVEFTSFNRADVTNEKLARLMDSGAIRYSGKYSTPDYELLLSGGCNLVIENTMITHSEEVLNQFHKLKMNTMIDYSSQESSPLGRMEWIKLYGVLTGKEETAEKIFEEKEKSLSGVYSDTGLSVAYFYITNNGGVVVRKNQDYISKLIEMAGGKYIFKEDSRYDGTGTMTIQKEDFFENVLNCDYLIYNSTIVGELDCLEDLEKKCEILSNTKAFKSGNVYCTTDNLYQSVMELPDIAEDMNTMLLGKSSSKYFLRLK